MRTPPPVEYPSVPGAAWQAAASLLVAAAVAVPLAWALPYLAARTDDLRPGGVLSRLGDPLVQAVLVAGTAAVVLAVFRLWQRRVRAAAERTLRWDGQDWLLVQPAGAAAGARRRGDAALMLDLGPWMLVRFLPHAGMGSATWLPLTAGVDPARWAALRGALWNWRPGREDAPA